jgi:hypothetical protein
VLRKCGVDFGKHLDEPFEWRPEVSAESGTKGAQNYSALVKEMLCLLFLLFLVFVVIMER